MKRRVVESGPTMKKSGEGRGRRTARRRQGKPERMKAGVASGGVEVAAADIESEETAAVVVVEPKSPGRRRRVLAART